MAYRLNRHALQKRVGVLQKRDDHHKRRCAVEFRGPMRLRRAAQQIQTLQRVQFFAGLRAARRHHPYSCRTDGRHAGDVANHRWRPPGARCQNRWDRRHTTAGRGRFPRKTRIGRSCCPMDCPFTNPRLQELEALGRRYFHFNRVSPGAASPSDGLHSRRSFLHNEIGAHHLLETAAVSIRGKTRKAARKKAKAKCG